MGAVASRMAASARGSRPSGRPSSRLDEGGIPYIEGLPDNVEITTRTGNNVKAVFIFNNTDKIQQFNYCGNELTLAPFEMKIEIE